jgi:DNA-binding response OmpR family regulator
MARRKNMTTNLLLVVEDEFLIRELLESLFAEAGFQVVAAVDGIHAMAELRVNATRFRAVVTDIKLGAGPDGWNVARFARELAPDMPIVYVSGNSALDWPAKGVSHSVFVQKPFTLREISTAVSSLLKVDSHPRQLSSCADESAA